MSSAHTNSGLSLISNDLRPTGGVSFVMLVIDKVGVWWGRCSSAVPTACSPRVMVDLRMNFARGQHVSII